MTPSVQPTPPASSLSLDSQHYLSLALSLPARMPSPARGAPPTDRTPLLAQIDHSLSRSLGRIPTRRSLGRSRSHDRPAGREDVPLPDGSEDAGASEFLIPTTLGEVVEARDDNDDPEDKNEDAAGGGSGDAGTALGRHWRLVKSRARY